MYIQKAPPAPPALGSVKMLFRIPPACFSLAELCFGMHELCFGIIAKSYGKYTLTLLNLSYPFGYLGLFLAIALALMHYAAPTLCNIVHMLDALCAYTLYML